MKKIHILLSCSLIMLCLSGCSKTKVENPNPEDAVPTGQSISNYIDSAPENKSESKPAASDGIDYDFTDMNFNILNAMNFEMAVDPEKFYGKVMKMRGQFFTVVEPESGQRFYYCVIYDPTACCQTGLDFMMTGDKVYPDDFPPEETYIEIQGPFKDFSNLLNDGRSYAGLLCYNIKILNEADL